VVFAKYPNCLIGPDAPIPVSEISDQVDYEGELALVIGTRCKSERRREMPYIVAIHDVADPERFWSTAEATSELPPGIVLHNNIHVRMGCGPSACGRQTASRWCNSLSTATSVATAATSSSRATRNTQAQSDRPRQRRQSRSSAEEGSQPLVAIATAALAGPEHTKRSEDEVRSF
jgi:hypothetical protein